MDTKVCLNCNKKMVEKVEDPLKESLETEEKDLNYCDSCITKLRKSFLR